MENKQKILIDPPSGWKYGFPKELSNKIDKNNPNDIKEWLIDNGYPEEEINKFGEFFYCRYISAPEDETITIESIKNDQVLDIEFEIDLISNKFKQIYFEDKSGYWFRRKFDFPIFKKVHCVVEPDNKKLYFEVFSKEGSLAKEYSVNNWKDCKKILKKHKLL